MTRSKVTGNSLANALHDFHRFNRCYHLKNAQTLENNGDTHKKYSIFLEKSNCKSIMLNMGQNCVVNVQLIDMIVSILCNRNEVIDRSRRLLCPTQTKDTLSSRAVKYGVLQIL